MKRKRLAREDTLRARPVRNQAVREENRDNGETILVIPRKKVWWVQVLSRIFYLPEERKIALDKIGAWVWRQCDGRASVGEIIEGLAREFKIGRREAEVSLLSYLRKLGEKRLVGFLLKAESGSSKN